MAVLKNASVLVTGACGTIGRELINQLLSDKVNSPTKVIGLDNSEEELFFLDQEYLDDARARFFVADVRDRGALSRLMTGVNVVFHAAALKHVILSERSPDQAVQTNILGVQNIIAAAHDTGVNRVLFTSSDKAVNPTSVMGTSKLMGERLMTAANSELSAGGTIFASTRFGNVLGSSGSVVPIFHRQIADGGPVTITDNEMTRFVMSISQAVRLVLDSAELARGGEVFITKMPVIRIQDLAEVMIAEMAPRHGHKASSIDVTTIGVKPGEKLYEELMSLEETRRAVELEHYFSVLPAFRGIYSEIGYDYEGVISTTGIRPYTSTNEIPVSRSGVKMMLESNNLLSASFEGAASRYWPGDKEEKA